ncbi:MAG: hypothetical protein LBI72_11415 [Flavobacteriaceae bacterium]|jgi:hypothetical protein|nr:hypothetical protein [Flavobacteriaceae bacterium]
MAKTIKSIICPQCGSNKIKELEKDYFQCNSCNTNFFLDTDDVTITHKHIFEGGQTIREDDKGKVIKIALTVLFAVVFVPLFISLFSNKKSSRSSVAAVAEKKYVNKVLSPKTFGKGLVELSKDKIAFVTLGYFDELKSDGQTEELYLYVIDAKTAKELKRAKQKVDITKKGAGVSKNWVEIESFLDANNNLYFIVNKYLVYLFDKQSMSLKDVTDTYFKDYPAFDSGVASVSISNRSFEYLTVTNNKGTKYAFVPAIKKVVPELEWSTLLALPLPKAEVKKRYLFVDKNEQHETMRLIQFEEKQQKGYPSYEVYSSATFNQYSEESGRIETNKDFTPKRIYNKGAQILAEDEEGVVIAVKIAKNDNEPYTIQKLKHTDGSVIWEVKTSWTEGILKMKQVDTSCFAFMINKTNVVVMNMKGEQVSAIVMEFTIE